MGDGIAINRFVFPAVDREVSLTIILKVELAEGYASFDRILEDAGQYASTMPDHLAWEPDIERNYSFHGYGS